jgi:hypothetical protein
LESILTITFSDNKRVEQLTYDMQQSNCSKRGKKRKLERIIEKVKQMKNEKSRKNNQKVEKKVIIHEEEHEIDFPKNDNNNEIVSTDVATEEEDLNDGT